MPDLISSIEYLQDLPLYKTEKPYWCMLTPRDGFDPDQERLDNLEFEIRDGITITDIRDSKENFILDKSGFQVLSHESEISSFDTKEDVDNYKAETMQVLKRELDAVFVKTYELRMRKNIQIDRSVMNIADPLLYEGPARGAHNDVTYNSGPVIINRYLSDEEKETYLKPGYRFRIINTWRSLVANLEDRPLALCDARTVAPDDFVAADRIIPDRVGEVYYLTYNGDHRWCYLSKQSPNEPYLFIMYDTAPGNNARCKFNA
ncbi:hypothetical protein BP6252_05027 [Coleophoma cylindrospora]|uniref:Uncharacterized protein n=1 Tax=Coleophoma cylindrospora TaxID=1849047 RepID=A0A3D8RSX6_9HELO|nr:hypothetical protein BP6252_05027 [Coleophoma cylindrospora]